MMPLSLKLLFAGMTLSAAAMVCASLVGLSQ